MLPSDIILARDVFGRAAEISKGKSVEKKARKFTAEKIEISAKSEQEIHGDKYFVNSDLFLLA